MTDLLERPPPKTLPWKQRYQRWLRVHQREQTRHAVIGAILCAAVVLGMQGVQARAAPPAPPPDNSADAVLSMAMVGDIMFGRHVQEVTRRSGASHPLGHVAAHLEGIDYVTGNLEQAILAQDPRGGDADYEEADKFIHLWSGSDVAEALVDAGFTNVNLANNHTMDFGEQGLADTLAALDDAGLRQVGAGMSSQEATDIYYEDVGGLTVATLGFTDVYVDGFLVQPFRGGVLPAHAEVIGPLVREAAAEADLVVAHVHWGDEYDWSPSPRQEELGRAMADEGADIVIGHHPHVLMPVEHYGDSLIFYSLGNFVFDQGWTRTRETVIAGYRLGEDGTATVELTPAYIREARPSPLQGWASRYRQERIFSQMTGRADGWQRQGDTLQLEIDHSHVIGGAADGE